MKIVQLITRMDVIGGAQNHVATLTTQLKKDGNEVIIITGSYDEKLWNFKNEDIPVILIPSLQREIHLLKDIQACITLRKILKEIKPDLMAIHSTKAGAIGRLVAFPLRIKTIFTAHGWSFTEGVSPLKKLFYRRIEYLLGLLTSKVIAVSEYDRLLAIQQKVISPKKIVAIHNGITEQINTDKVAGFQEEIPTIAMVARFEAPKRQDLLIDALSKLKVLKWKAVFVGEGVHRIQVEEQVKKYGLQDRVQFLISTANVEQVLSKSQLFVLLSNFEGLPLSIIEAMRAGVPVVASNVGGVSELINDSQNGFLIQNHDLNQLRDVLQQLLSSNELRRKMGDQGNRLFLRSFTFNTMYLKTLEQYKNVVQPDSEKIKVNVKA